MCKQSLYDKYLEVVFGPGAIELCTLSCIEDDLKEIQDDVSHNFPNKNVRFLAEHLRKAQEVIKDLTTDKMLHELSKEQLQEELLAMRDCIKTVGPLTKKSRARVMMLTMAALEFEPDGP